MQTNEEKHKMLSEKVADLARRQEEFSQEIQRLQIEIVSLSATDDSEKFATESVEQEVEEPVAKKLHRDKADKVIGGVCSGIGKYSNINTGIIRLLFIVALIFSFGLFFFLYLLLILILPLGDKRVKASLSTPVHVTSNDSVPTPDKPKVVTLKPTSKKPIISSSIERFIGENLINKIGIIIIVIGVAIGAKYSIDNDLISPLTRIVLGYLVGLALLGFGISLKKKYENYSAVLVSGAMAILYFITYFSYEFYELIPQTFAFVLMVLFTGFTVLASLSYNKQVIAIIGLAGAYIVPFLLSEGNGDVTILLSYITIINFGILYVAFKKYWKPLYYISFFASWSIFASWFFSMDDPTEFFGSILSFLTIFFLTFYVAFLGYKVLQKEKFEINNIWLLLVNSFIFYGLGYIILDHPELSSSSYLGLFTLGNAVLHFLVSLFIYKQKLGDKNLFYLISGLVLVFITIAIPVQLEGNWVTLLWVGEGALLFWIGRSKGISTYEKLSYPLMLLAFISLTQDYLTIYENNDFLWDQTSVTPLLNANFLTSILFIAAFAFIAKLNLQKASIAFPNKKTLESTLTLGISGVLLLSIYSIFRIEIINYWNQLMVATSIEVPYDEYSSDTHFNHNLIQLKRIWIINYSLIFTALLSFVNFKKIKSSKLGVLNAGLIGLALLVFLSQGLLELSTLRGNYLGQYYAEYFVIGTHNITIRYISLAFFALTLVAAHKFIRPDHVPFDLKKSLDFVLHISLIWILSSELIHWLDMGDSNESYKLGLSILWAIYSLLLVILGIWKTKKHLRIGGISLFGVTLVKLFFYDISHLDTISKTIVFVSLGIVLLVVSFLYNKYNKVISDEKQD